MPETPHKTQDHTPPRTPPSIPATAADIARVLNKLDKMQNDNTSIKKQLNEIQKTFQTKIDTVEAKISDVEDKTKSSIQDNKEKWKQLNPK